MTKPDLIIETMLKVKYKEIIKLIFKLTKDHLLIMFF